ncbi:MAG: D-Ala-D-Ala carboxypeptidase family metallohydrolase [Eubacteriales bacterium]
MLKMRDRGVKVSALQQNLASLGYPLADDGVFGLATLRAVREFQADHGLAVDGIVGHFTEMALFDALNEVEIVKPASEHFAYEDFISESDLDAVSNGIPYAYWENIQTVMDRLEVVRKSIGDKHIIIRSGYRSKKYNRRVGGAKNSQHLYGKAVDIYVKDRVISCSDLANIIYFDDALKPLFGGYGLGSDTNVHLDIRERKNPMKPTLWWYGKKSWKEWR